MAGELILAIVNVFTILIFIRIIISWVVLLFASMRWLLYNPAVEFLNAVTEPILAPIRSVMPNLGGIDLSPLIAILLLRFVGAFLAQSLS